MKRITTRQIPLVKAGLLKRQNFKCPICTTTLTIAEACLDHCHDTGRIRGALCRNCNGIEGKIKSLARRGRRTLPKEDYIGMLILYWRHHAVDRTGVLHPLHRTDDEKRLLRNKKARITRAKAKLKKG